MGIDMVKVSLGYESELRKLYLQYVNQFLTYQGVANYYGWTLQFTTKSINLGRELHERYCSDMKKESE